MAARQKRPFGVVDDTERRSFSRLSKRQKSPYQPADEERPFAIDEQDEHEPGMMMPAAPAPAPAPAPERTPSPMTIEDQIPRWTLHKNHSHVYEAFINVLQMPEVDYVLYIKWLTIQMLYADIFKCGFAENGSSAGARKIPDIQQISTMASKYGKLPFVWSADAYVTKSKIVGASERVVLEYFAASKYYKDRSNKFDAIERATAFTTEDLPARVAEKYEGPRKGLVLVIPDQEKPTRYSVHPKDLAVYKAYWTVLHPADDYKHRVDSLHQKAADPQALIHAWASVFTIKAAKEHAKIYKDALLLLLQSLRTLRRNKKKKQKKRAMP